MPFSGDISGRRAEIEDLVSEGEHKQGFLRAIDFAKEFAPSSDLRHEAVILSGEYNTIAKNLRRGLLSQDDFLTRLRRLTLAMLELLDDIVDAVMRSEPA